MYQESLEKISLSNISGHRIFPPTRYHKINRNKEPEIEIDSTSEVDKISDIEI